jgi:molecular chaperone HscB
MINTSYFELLGIEERFSIDIEALKKSYYKSSRKYHPDFFTSASVSEQEEAAQMSEYINEAYKVLGNDRLRIQYILRRMGILVEGEKNDLDQSFLLEMMEINELIFEAQEDNVVWESVESKIKEFSDILGQLGQSAMNEFDKGIDKDANLLKIKEYYLKSRYLERIIENVEGIESI